MGRKLFIGGLPPTVTLEQFQAYFTEFGETEEVKLIMSWEDPALNRGFGFVTYKEQDVADNVAGQAHAFDEQPIQVKISESGDNQLHLWIGGIPEEVTEDDLKEHFGKYGEVQNVHVKREKMEAYVDIEKKGEETEKCLTEEHKVKGTVLQVDKNWSKNKRRRWGRRRQWNYGMWGGYGSGQYAEQFAPYAGGEGGGEE